jgi:hypothetical protein
MPQQTPNPFARDTDSYTIFEALTTERTDTPPLLPKRVYAPETTKAIKALYQNGTVSHNVAALLHLLNDDLNSAHVLCQAHEDESTANYIHMIVHRREGDFSNTRYWVMRTGAHPLLSTLDDLAEKGGSKIWNGNEMVAWCTRGEHFAAGLSDAETQRLLAWCVENRE